MPFSDKPRLLNLEKVKQAHACLKPIVTDTPYSYAPHLSAVSGSDVYLKKENLQITGSFKIRGAFNRINALSPEEKSRGVVAASAGNHAQGVAFAAAHFGIRAVIVMPDSTPMTKISGVEHYGAEVVLEGNNYDEAYAYAMRYCETNEMVFVHPFADEDVMAGQGTIALDILACDDKLDAVLVPVGGGGLISGIATAIKATDPSIEVIGVSAAGAPAMKNSFDAKHPVDSTGVRTIADGIAVRDTSPVTLEHILKNVDRMVAVDDEEIASAMLFLLEKQKLVVEGAGAVGVAVLLHRKLPHLEGRRVAVVLSGGNVDVTLLSVVIEKGLLKSYRKMKLTVTLVDKPGSLMKLTELLRNQQANIVHIAYDRTSTDLEYGDANVTIHLETKGQMHQAQIRDLLSEHGYLSHEGR